MNAAQLLSSIFQALPRFRGKRRICRLIMKVTGIAGMKDASVKTKAGKYILPNLVEIISFDLFVNGYYEPGLVQWLQKSIPPNGVFIDVGANIGSITISLSRLRPDIRIIAVEASPWIYRILEKNISMNNIANVTLLNNAVYKVTGESLPMYAPRELFGKGSLKPVYTSDSEMVNTISVDDICVRFDIVKVDAVKVDVEGFEASVFQGMDETFRKSRPRIIFEYSDWTEREAGFEPTTAQRILLANGYTLQKLNHNFIPEGQPLRTVLEQDYTNILAE